MLIIDNFLSQSDFQRIKNTIESPNFSWNFSNVNRAKEKAYWKSQYVHLFMSIYADELHFATNNIDILQPIINFLAPQKIIRIKCNSSPMTDKIFQCGWHKDTTGALTYSAIYYVNTNDGYTAFKNGNRINSIENRLAIFDSRLDHSATTTTNVKRRIVINFVFHASNQTITNIGKYNGL